MSEELIVGRQPVMEALRAGRPLNKIYILKDKENGRRELGPLVQRARSQGMVIVEVDRASLERLAGGNYHQGVVASAAPRAYVEPEVLLARARERGEDPLLILAAEIEDPQNLGAIIRTAEAAGAHGLIIAKHRSAPLTAAVGRASAGAVEHLPVSRVANLSQTVEWLKEQGCWAIGADASADTVCYQADLKGPLVLVVGSEGRGIPALLAKKCDILVKLPMYGMVGSLNVSAATAVLLYEALRQRRSGQW